MVGRCARVLRRAVGGSRGSGRRGTVGGLRWCARRRAGPGTGPDGWWSRRSTVPGSAAVEQEQAALLVRARPQPAGRHHVIAPDPLGFGFSDAPPAEEFSYAFDAIAEVAAHLLAQPGLALLRDHASNRTLCPRVHEWFPTTGVPLPAVLRPGEPPGRDRPARPARPWASSTAPSPAPDGGAQAGGGAAGGRWRIGAVPQRCGGRVMAITSSAASRSASLISPRSTKPRSTTAARTVIPSATACLATLAAAS